MSKLTLKDVKIIGEGPQIRKAILQRYKSVEEFYKEHSDVANKLPTLNNYLSRDVIISDSFKCRMTFILDVDYPSLFVTKANQIKKHVQNLCNSINLYDKENDKQIFEYLIEHCKEGKLEEELSMMYRAKAIYYYNTNRIDHCVEYYEYATETPLKVQINKLVSYNCEVANYLLRENCIEKADTKYSYIGKLVHMHKGKLDNDTLFFYYYRRGIAYMHKGDYSGAKEFFMKAEEYSTHNRAKSSAIANIGLVYKKQRKYDEALQYYMDALNYPDPSNVLTIASIYNNIAEAYKVKKDYPRALEYIEKALEISEKENDLGKHLIYTSTKAQIQFMQGYEEAHKKFFNLLLISKTKKIFKPDILIAIKISIENINDIPCLKELIRIIMIIKKESASSDYNKGLAECAGLATFKIMELNKEV